MGQISVTNARFPKFENYLVLILLLWLCMSSTACHFSSLPVDYVFRYTFARVIVAASMEKHFAVPAKRSQIEINRGAFPWEALPAAELVEKLSEKAKRGGEWQKLDRLVKAIVYAFPLLAALIAVCIYAVRKRSKDPSANPKDVVRGVQVNTYKRSLWQRIFLK